VSKLSEMPPGDVVARADAERMAAAELLANARQALGNYWLKLAEWHIEQGELAIAEQIVNATDEVLRLVAPSEIMDTVRLKAVGIALPQPPKPPGSHLKLVS